MSAESGTFREKAKPAQHDPCVQAWNGRPLILRRLHATSAPCKRAPAGSDVVAVKCLGAPGVGGDAANALGALPEQVARKVALRARGRKGDDALAGHVGPGGKHEGGGHVGTRRNPRRNAFAFASARAISKAASLEMAMTSSMSAVSSTAGTKPAPMPWILCGPRRPPDRTGLADGSTAIILRSGRRGFKTRPQPVKVPPVPTPITSASTLPCVSAQISSAVVKACTSGLAGFSNWLGCTAPGRLASNWPARSMAAGMPPAAGVSSSSAPSKARILRRSTDIDFGITKIRR